MLRRFRRMASLEEIEAALERLAPILTEQAEKVRAIKADFKEGKATKVCVARQNQCPMGPCACRRGSGG